jgi:hypothetical protein
MITRIKQLAGELADFAEEITTGAFPPHRREVTAQKSLKACYG